MVVHGNGASQIAPEMKCDGRLEHRRHLGRYVINVGKVPTIIPMHHRSPDDQDLDWPLEYALGTFPHPCQPLEGALKRV